MYTMARSENTRIAGNESGLGLFTNQGLICVFGCNVLTLTLSISYFKVLRSFGIIFKKEVQNLNDVCLSLCLE